ncbi:MAG: hypothetical protein KF712_07160 [Akkermansiaceae bacterium]|nr:hypothetical protein [Akkermansiaceae bacterium]
MKSPLALILPPALAMSSQAALVADNFDALTNAGLSGKFHTGTGFVSGAKWTGSSLPGVVDGTLSSTLYNISQPGNKFIRGTNSTDMRQAFGMLAAPMSGEIWFSFLAQTSQTTIESQIRWSSTGLSLNSPTATPFSDRGDFYVQMSGGRLEYKFGTNHTAGSVQVYGGTELAGVTTLVVGRLLLGGTGTGDSVDLWVNPDLIANPDISSLSTAYSATGINGLASINQVGIVVHRTSSNLALESAAFDALRMSNNPDGFSEVTGVPEPSAWMLAAGMMPLFMAVRCRKEWKS